MEDLLWPLVTIPAFLLGRYSFRWHRKPKPRGQDGSQAYQEFKESQR